MLMLPWWLAEHAFVAVWGHRRGRGAVHTFRGLFLLLFCGTGVGGPIGVKVLGFEKEA